MKKLFAALVLVAASVFVIGGPATGQGQERVDFCHVPPGNPDNAKFHEDRPLSAWENGHEGGNGAHSLDTLGGTEEECEGPGDDDDDGGDDDDDGDDDDGDDDDKDKDDNDGALASTGV
jgi:hypothetical protein